MARQLVSKGAYLETTATLLATWPLSEGPGRTSTPGRGTLKGRPAPPEVAVHTALTLLMTRLQINRRRLLFHLAR